MEMLAFISNPRGSGLARSGPKPLVSPYGPGYSMHPELSRSGAGYLMSRLFVPTAVMASVVTATTTLSSEGGEPGALFTSYPGVGSALDQYLI